MFDAKSTVVVELTPTGRGAVAVVLVAGPEALPVVDTCFTPASGRALSSAALNQIVLGRWGGPEGEELVVCRRAADEIEVHCHGGEAAVNAVIDSLVAQGCRRMAWQEWLPRRRVSPRLELGSFGETALRDRVSPRLASGLATTDSFTRAAQIALAYAPTARTAAVLLDQLHGALSEAVHQVSTAVAAGDWKLAGEISDSVLRFRDVGLHLTRPWRVVLCGPPNVGKSSLLNAIAGYQRAIVSPQPGTTRDVVTLTTAVEGWPVEFADTAGLRSGQDELEAAGIALAEATVQEADLVVVVHDATAMPGSGTTRLAGKRKIHVVNKTDLVGSAPVVGHYPSDAIATSAVTGAGIADLLAAIARALAPAVPPAGAAVPFTRGQVDALANIRVAVDARDAASARRALQAMLAE